MSDSLQLTVAEWYFVFKSLDMSRQTFATNPVLIDVLPAGDRRLYSEEILGIMTKIYERYSSDFNARLDPT